MAEENETYTSNWAAMYVFISLIPVITVMIMVYSNWSDRTKQAATDVEIAARAAAYERYWFPWRQAVVESEGPGARAGPSSTTNTAAPVSQVSLPMVRESLHVPAKTETPVTVSVTAPTPSPPPVPPKPAPVAHPSRPSRQPFDNTANERWGEGPHGYGARRSSAANEGEFEDVWL